MEAVSLEQVREEFSRWRKNRFGREKIPDFLWSLCLRGAQKHKLSHVAKAASVDYYQLRARVEKAMIPKAIAVSALNSPGAPHLPVSKISLSHRSGWTIEIDPNDPVSIHFLKSFFSTEEQDAPSLTSNANFPRSQSGGFSEGHRITRRIYLGATAD